jgi:hypothetical protein
MGARTTAAVLASLLSVGLVSFVFVRSKHGEGGALVWSQEHVPALTPVAVAEVVRTAPDPVTLARGTSANCVPLGRGELLNPWRCSISYSSGRQIQYLVTIRVDGSYSGGDEIVRYRGDRYRDTGMITGCCVDVP